MRKAWRDGKEFAILEVLGVIMMNPSYLIDQLGENAGRIAALVKGVSPEDMRWKPDPSSWSFLEVINHLWDEEREDFRVRLGITLDGAGQEWPPIDPEGWVTSRRYNARDFDLSLAGFLSEREVSLLWLRSLGDVNWDAEYEASFGVMRAGDLLASWLSHDYLHTRQIVELHRARGLARSGIYLAKYAGDW